jgi:dihydropteroate synthase
MTSSLSSELFLRIGEKENLLILKAENMKRLKALLGDRPIFFGSSRKRFLGAIMKRSADLAMALSSDAAPDVINKDSGPAVLTEAAPSRAPSIEELDWATAGTTAAAVIGATTLTLPFPFRVFCSAWL